MKKDLHKDYAALCSAATVPATSGYLFGDLSKLTKDISGANKLTKKVRPPKTQHYTQRKFWLEWPSLQSYKPRNSRQSPVPPISTDKKWFFVQRPPSKDKIEEGGRIKAGLTRTSPSTTKVCKLLRCNPAINEVHMLLSSLGSFKAGQIMWCLPHWQEITNDPTVLQCVKGIKIKFKPGMIPFQANVWPSTFNQSQHDIVAVEIDKLL